MGVGVRKRIRNGRLLNGEVGHRQFGSAHWGWNEDGTEARVPPAAVNE